MFHQPIDKHGGGTYLDLLILMQEIEGLPQVPELKKLVAPYDPSFDKNILVGNRRRSDLNSTRPRLNALCTRGHEVLTFSCEQI